MNTTRLSIRKFSQLLLAGLTVIIVVSTSCVPIDVSQPQPLTRKLARQIEQTYGIVLVDRDAHWTVYEALSIWRALERLACRMKVVFGAAGEPALKALLEGSCVLSGAAGSGDKIAYTIAGTVSFYDVWASSDEAHQMFYLYHEMGHLLDTRGSLMNLFMGEISGQFSGHVGSYVDDQGQYQLGAEFPQPEASQPIRHRTDSASEDWAETFASVLMPEFENDLRDVGTPRVMEVVRQFSTWLAQPNRERPKETAMAEAE